MQMLKTSNPALTLLIMKAFGVPLPAPKAIFFVGIVIMGTILEIDKAVSVTLFGLTIAVLAEVFDVLSMVLTQKMLHVEKFSVLESLYVLTGPSCASLWLIAAPIEWPQLYRTGQYQAFVSHALSFAAAATVGLLINLGNMIVLEATSSVAMKLLVVVRSILLVALSGIVYHEHYAPLQILGYAVGLFGCLGYMWAQNEHNSASTK
eukprot:gnl/TRDRNA2_/TRDRNA2_176406_c1_seq2.p1 gnl/TRDRNA2_/TRDRNA2_176406_c1~~gnl/TRDRNA2_/TRDRNA2_176406_c1_seq2.p1  ORF type:complete len:206 (-),score=18.07 gnl/TRDRNA2_/TRDRNA2_176406_c1_seq2:57-674(-)